MRNAVRLQKEALLFTDERSKLESELLNGIDVVKCNSWEVRTLPPAPARLLTGPHGPFICRACWHQSQRSSLPVLII